ncbi:MAG: hypothetical protein R2827_10110 [Bdellovibrionales bacterium]
MSGRATRRHKLRYGKVSGESVSQIITYGKLQARAAIRDVGRVMGMTYGDVIAYRKLMPDVLGITIDEAIKTELELENSWIKTQRCKP